MEDLLSDLPIEAVKATTRGQFVSHMRPYAWVKFPSATATEVNTIINARWTLLKESRKSGIVYLCICSTSHARGNHTDMAK